MLLVSWIQRSTTSYRITSKRVEWTSGLFTRKIDGIDVWRIRHVEYVQTLGDRFGGVSRLQLEVQDRQEPRVTIPGLPASREVYDKVTAAAQLDRRATVGLVQ